MSFVNNIVVEGRLTREPELQFSKNGNAYCRFSICHNQNRKIVDSDSEEVSWESIPNFFNCVAFRYNAETVAQMSKGQLVSVVGKLQFSQYEKDGEKKSSVSILADSVKKLLIEKREKGTKNVKEKPEKKEAEELENYNDEIPF